jgi:hypothetical protein
MEPAKASSRRCAIYTRKSSEEGPEQDFNSLQAQREALIGLTLRSIVPNMISGWFWN